MFEHDYPFDPTHGYDEQALRNVTPPPEAEDFADFWRNTFDEAMAVPLNLTSQPSDLSDSKWVVHELEFDSLGGMRIGGWLTLPRDEPPRIGIVTGHGYGGRAAPDRLSDQPPAARLFFCARGFHRSAHPGLPDNSREHVVHGIASRETYIIRGCVTDLWAATSALLELHPELREHLFYSGGSFGGGLGALALPWDARICRGHLRDPTFGHHPLRVTLPCEGSGKAVTAYYQKHPEVLDVLRYFDAAVAAKYLRIPMHVSCALFDPKVPPAGQFAIYNAMTCPRKLLVRSAGHFAHEGTARENLHLAREVRDWFAQGYSVAT